MGNNLAFIGFAVVVVGLFVAAIVISEGGRMNKGSLKGSLFIGGFMVGFADELVAARLGPDQEFWGAVTFGILILCVISVMASLFINYDEETTSPT